MKCATWRKLKYIKMLKHVKKVFGANIKNTYLMLVYL